MSEDLNEQIPDIPDRQDDNNDSGIMDDIKDKGKEKLKEKIDNKGAEKTGQKGLEKAGQEGTQKAGQEAGKQGVQKAGQQGAQKASQEAGKQAAQKVGQEGVKKAGQEAGKQVAKEAGKQVAKEAGKQVAKEAGKQAVKQGAKAAVGAAAGAATAGIATAAMVAAEVAMKAAKKIQEAQGLSKQDARARNAMVAVGLMTLPLIIIMIIVFFIIYQEGKRMDTQDMLHKAIACAESADGCNDFLGIDEWDIVGIGAPINQWENGEWDPFHKDDVTDFATQYVAMTSKYSLEDDAISSFPVLGKHVPDEDPGLLTDILNWMGRIEYLKRKRLEEHLSITPAAFNNISWKAYSPTSEKKFQKGEYETVDLGSWKIGGWSVTYYNIDKKDFKNNFAKIDEMAKNSEDHQTSLRIPESKDFGISVEEYLAALGPNLPHWIEPYALYVVTGDEDYVNKLIEFYSDESEHYQVTNYLDTKEDTTYYYNKHVQTVQDKDEEGNVIATRNITYYGKKPDYSALAETELRQCLSYLEVRNGILDSFYVDLDMAEMQSKYSYIFDEDGEYIDGNVYCPDSENDKSKYIYTPGVNKALGWTGEIDTDYDIEFISLKEFSFNIEADRYEYKKTFTSNLTPDTEVKPYEYTNITGETKEAKNRMEWWIMKTREEGLERIKNGTGYVGDGETFTYDIDSLAQALEMIEKYYEKNYYVGGVYTGEPVVIGGVDYISPGGLLFPVQGGHIVPVTGPYRSPARPTHNGIDIVKAGPKAYLDPATDENIKTYILSAGTPHANQYSGWLVIAAADGEVTQVNSVGTNVSMYPSGGWGNNIVIKHTPSNYMTRYAHLFFPNNVPLVSPGQSVVAGQVIGVAGDSGCSAGIHLHFELFTPPLNRIDPMVAISI